LSVYVLCVNYTYTNAPFRIVWNYGLGTFAYSWIISFKTRRTRWYGYVFRKNEKQKNLTNILRFLLVRVHIWFVFKMFKWFDWLITQCWGHCCIYLVSGCWRDQQFYIMCTDCCSYFIVLIFVYAIKKRIRSIRLNQLKRFSFDVHAIQGIFNGRFDARVHILRLRTSHEVLSSAALPIKHDCTCFSNRNILIIRVYHVYKIIELFLSHLPIRLFEQRIPVYSSVIITNNSIGLCVYTHLYISIDFNRADRSV